MRGYSIILNRTEYSISNWVDVICIFRRQDIAQMSLSTSIWSAERLHYGVSIYTPLLRWELVYEDHLKDTNDFLEFYTLVEMLKIYRSSWNFSKPLQFSFDLYSIASHCRHLLSIRACCFVLLQGSWWLNYLCTLVTIELGHTMKFNKSLLAKWQRLTEVCVWLVFHRGI